MYDKLRLIYMSGTGNTYRVARWMAETAQKESVETEVMTVFDPGTTRRKPGKNDLTGFLVPCHAFLAPWSAIKCALHLPGGAGSHAFSINTGEVSYKDKGKALLPQMRGITSHLIALILLLKGYRIRGIAGIEMPANWSVVMSAYKSEKIEAIKKEARSFTSTFTQRLLAGERSFHQWYNLIIGILFLPLSLAYLLGGRFFLAKLFFSDERCNGCGQCAKICPKKAITMMGEKTKRPYWSFKCESCMRCMGYCPQNAIQASYLWALLFTLLSCIPLASLASAALAGVLSLPWVATSGLAWFGLYYIQCFMLIWAAYHILIRLARIPAINRLFANTTPTRRFRRYHEPETKPHELK